MAAPMFSEDRDYVERALAGEPEAFESLVRKYNRMGGAIALAVVGDFHEAEDVVQESFLKAFRSLHTLREGGKFKYWFAGLVRSKAIDCMRQRRSHVAAELSEDARDTRLPSRPAGAEEDYLHEETRLKIMEAIRELPEDDRLAIVLKHMEGLSYREIAEIVETSVGAVESRLFRARQLLKKKLNPTQI